MAISAPARDEANSHRTVTKRDHSLTNEWLEYLEAANKPAAQLFSENLQNIANLRREDRLTDAMVTELIRQLTATHLAGYIEDAAEGWLFRISAWHRGCGSHGPGWYFGSRRAARLGVAR